MSKFQYITIIVLLAAIIAMPFIMKKTHKKCGCQAAEDEAAVIADDGE